MSVSPPSSPSDAPLSALSIAAEGAAPAPLVPSGPFPLSADPVAAPAPPGPSAHRNAPGVSIASPASAALPLAPPPEPTGPQAAPPRPTPISRVAARFFAYRPGSLQIVLFCVAVAITLLYSYLGWWPDVIRNPQTVLLPYFIVRTLLRMVAAFLLVFVFSLVVGITAGLFRRPRQVILPVLDILQSIPVLGYLPAAMYLFTTLIGAAGGTELGYELAAIFLIFTGMAWATTFSVISAVRNIPNDMREACNCFGVRGLDYLRAVILPIILPSFVTGSILAWGGGWYFLVAAELFQYGSTTYALPGLGSYIGNALFTQSNMPSAFFGLTLFISLVYFINQTVWNPLRIYSRRFRVQTMMGGGLDRAEVEPASFALSSLKSLYAWLDLRLSPGLRALNQSYMRLRPTRIRLFGISLAHVPRRRRHLPLPWYQQGTLYGLAFLAIMALTALFYSVALEAPLRGLEHSVLSHPQVWTLPELAVRSTLRILIAYILALAWTLTAAIIVTRSKTLSDLFFPLFDIGQSTPALALFPFMVVFVVGLFPNPSLGVEAASILLMLTGMQWYLLFNIIGAIRQIPGDILEAARAFDIQGWPFYRDVLLPAILPGILLGSIQAWGGAWNASIVSEFIQFQGLQYSVPGLGSFLTHETLSAAPDPWVITLAVASMTAVVLALNTLVWKPLFAYSERFKFQS